MFGESDICLVLTFMTCVFRLALSDENCLE